MFYQAYKRLGVFEPFKLPKVPPESCFLEKRLESLETRVEHRLMETWPIWEAVLSRLEKVEARLDKIEARLDKIDERLESIEKDVRVIRDQVEDAILQVADTRGRQRDHERRLKALERESPVKPS